MPSVIGTLIPIANEITIKITPTTNSFQPEKLNFFWISPKSTANTINIIDTIPAEPLIEALGKGAPVTASNDVNVPETISANTAMIKSEKSQQKSKKSFLPVLPIYFSISIPIDLP